MKPTLTDLVKDIERTKSQLTVKAEKRGLWENFGEKEARELDDKYASLTSDYWDETAAKARDLIHQFRAWAWNYTPRH